MSEEDFDKDLDLEENEEADFEEEDDEETVSTKVLPPNEFKRGL